jgi:hypothetical protein
VLTFDPAAHQYHYDGKPVVNVTRVLAPLIDLSMVKPEQLEIARQKGVATHRMVELWAKGDLDEATLPDWMQPILKTWLKVVDETGLEVIASEQRVYHRTLRYAGTYDLKARIRARPGVGIIDVKRSFFAGPVVGIQTAAYEAAEADKDIKWRAGLRLREDQPYRLEMYDDKTDFSTFLALLTIHNFKRKHSQ